MEWIAAASPRETREMTDRQKTRERPNRRRAFAQSYGSLLNEGFNRRTVLKGFLASTAVATLGGAFGVRSVDAANEAAP